MSPPADRAPLVALLAAGKAKRFGGGKLDADLLDRPLGAWPLAAVAKAGFAPGIIVVGPDGPQFASVAADWELLTNPAPEDGLGGSVSLAVQHALAAERDCLLLLADMPLVDADHLQRLAAAPSSSATRWPDDHLGVPALIRRDDLPLFAALEGDRGAGPLLSGLEDIVRIFAPAQMLLDVDRKEDLVQARELLEGEPR
ncbi:nucleotidyltransferase family protein [Aurantiacibacter hainanensis]|uniref:nucleotidyltransferase family protein n=1 Tax=Aurantiacibacter hainanensis TaxID=3076114 RepID=UPI0030C753C8